MVAPASFAAAKASQRNSTSLRLASSLKRLERGVHVLLSCSGERRHAAAPDLASHTAHGLEVPWGSNREAGLDHIDAQLFELPRQPQLLLDVHGKAGGLLAVAQSGIEDVDGVHAAAPLGSAGELIPERPGESNLYFL